MRPSQEVSSRDDQIKYTNYSYNGTVNTLVMMQWERREQANERAKEGGWASICGRKPASQFSGMNKQNIDTTRLITCSKHWERGREDRREGSSFFLGGGGGEGNNQFDFQVELTDFDDVTSVTYILADPGFFRFTKRTQPSRSKFCPTCANKNLVKECVMVILWVIHCVLRDILYYKLVTGY